MRQLISSQRFRDAATVAEKRDAEDYVVTVYPIDVGGKDYDVVVDGHHSLAAAILDGAEPTLVDVPRAIAAEYEYEIEHGGEAGWLEAHWIDAPYYDVYTGDEVDFGMVPNACAAAVSALAPDEALAVIEPYFLVVKEKFDHAGYGAIRRTALKCDPGQHDTARHFAGCRDDGREIVVAPELADLNHEVVLAILAHECGHALDFLYPGEFVLRERAIARRCRDTETDKQWRKFLTAWKQRDDDTVELTADAIAERVLGVPIGYRGPCMLQSFGGIPRPLGLR